MGGWDEGAKWFVEMIRLDPEQGESAEEDGGISAGKDAQVAIQDANRQIAKMAITGNTEL